MSAPDDKPRGEGACFSLGLVRLGATHTFCCLCFIGAVGMVLVGVTAWLSVEDERDIEGHCVVTDGGVCGCGKWSGDMRCTSREAVFNSVDFSSPNLNTTCTLKMGPNTLRSCLNTTLTYRGSYYSLNPPNFTTPYPCKLNEDTYNCFPSPESLHNHGSTQYYGLIIGGSIWGFLTLCVLIVSLLYEAKYRGVRHTRLVEGLEELEAAEAAAGKPVNVEREGCYMKGDYVAVRVAGEWESGRVTGRGGVEEYDVEVSGETVKKVGREDVRSAGFKVGGWVVVTEPLLSETMAASTAESVEVGVLGVVTGLSPSNAVEVCIGASLFSPTPGQVIPTPAVRRGHKVDIRINHTSPWEEGVVEGVHGDGILLVSRTAQGCIGSPKAFHWVRRPEGIVIEKLPDPEVPEEPSTYIFVDPDHRLAPTVMATDEVMLYGGVRAVSRDLAEYRAAPAGKILISAALLSSSHLMAQHLSRSERATEQKSSFGQKLQPPAQQTAKPTPPPTPKTEPY